MSTYVSGNLVPEAERQKCPHIFGALLTNFEVFRYAALDSRWRIVRIFTRVLFRRAITRGGNRPARRESKASVNVGKLSLPLERSWGRV